MLVSYRPLALSFAGACTHETPQSARYQLEEEQAAQRRAHLPILQHAVWAAFLVERELRRRDGDGFRVSALGGDEVRMLSLPIYGMIATHKFLVES